MKSYIFTAMAECRLKGYVIADSEENAIKKIRSLDVEDIFDYDYEEPVYDIKITNEEDID